MEPSSDKLSHTIPISPKNSYESDIWERGSQYWGPNSIGRDPTSHLMGNIPCKGDPPARLSVTNGKNADFFLSVSLRITGSPAMLEGFGCVQLGSPNHQFWDPMILMAVFPNPPPSTKNIRKSYIFDEWLEASTFIIFHLQEFWVSRPLPKKKEMAAGS